MATKRIDPNSIDEQAILEIVAGKNKRNPPAALFVSRQYPRYNPYRNRPYLPSAWPHTSGSSCAE